MLRTVVEEVEEVFSMSFTIVTLMSMETQSALKPHHFNLMVAHRLWLALGILYVAIAVRKEMNVEDAQLLIRHVLLMHLDVLLTIRILMTPAVVRALVQIKNLILADVHVEPVDVGGRRRLRQVVLRVLQAMSVERLLTTVDRHSTAEPLRRLGLAADAATQATLVPIINGWAVQVSAEIAIIPALENGVEHPIMLLAGRLVVRLQEDASTIAQHAEQPILA